MLKINAAALAIAMLVGCAGPQTMNSVRQDAAHIDTFTVEHELEPLYETLLTNARECFGEPLFIGAIEAQGDFWPRRRAAEIRVVMTNGAGILHAIDIQELATRRAKVTTYTASAALARAKRHELVRAWATAGSSSCELAS